MKFKIVGNGALSQYPNLLEKVNILLKEHGNGAVLPVPEGELNRRFEEHEALVAIIGDCIVGYVALSHVGAHAVEVRSLVTNRDYRHHGIGTALIIAMTEVASIHHAGKHIVAMASSASEGLFRKQNFEDPTPSQLSLLKKDLLGECVNCSLFQQEAFQGKMCCHTMLVWHKKES